MKSRQGMLKELHDILKSIHGQIVPFNTYCSNMSKMSDKDVAQILALTKKSIETKGVDKQQI